eukprot:scaffold218166_cov29-Prasinocladus_malaysianus.AAC.1
MGFELPIEVPGLRQLLLAGCQLGADRLEVLRLFVDRLRQGGNLSLELPYQVGRLGRGGL